MADPYEGDSSPDWNTPRSVLDVIEGFHPIDLDPCSNEHSLVNAGRAVCLPDDGMLDAWYTYGHTYVNPPYSKGEVAKWTAKASSESRRGARHITMLINACPETKAWKDNVWPHASRVAFWRTRIKFEKPDGGTGTKLPSAIVYYGADVRRFDRCFAEHCTIMRDWL